MSYVSIVPTGVDRADGLLGREGTATPAEARLVQSPGGLATIPLQEFPDSPTIERAEQCTVTHRFTVDWNEGLTRLSALSRGAIMYDSYGNTYRVLSATIQHQKPGYGILTVVTESISFDVPWDQFGITPVELGVNILKHPRYLYSFSGANSTEYSQNQSVIRAVQNYMENPSPTMRNALPKQIYDSIGDATGTTSTDGVQHLKGTDMAKRAALEVIMKYWRNEETPYMVGYMLTWSSFFWQMPYLNPGGYIEDPLADGGLPDYFHNPFYPLASSATIFDRLPIFNPQCYSSTGLSTGATRISWLRKADEVEFERTWFKLRRTWIGSPVGYWDPAFFAASRRPQVVGDYEVYDPTAIPLP